MIASGIPGVNVLAPPQWLVNFRFFPVYIYLLSGACQRILNGMQSFRAPESIP
ncbi:hypothetical protein M404DRAFT_992042 [Pisolithus tinctorius Marx 270]|uniref:Uncharacterized protein n=1 Tax=Pisolithus tinctorius Marx 270 TaxID=870435 RepID=A0A0C3PWR8_PISTI|nr:hypothetical protein M404DRAFT_992042 [Pisolithus tinctorius Marx 270]